MHRRPCAARRAIVSPRPRTSAARCQGLGWRFALPDARWPVLASVARWPSPRPPGGRMGGHDRDEGAHPPRGRTLLEAMTTPERLTRTCASGRPRVMLRQRRRPCPVHHARQAVPPLDVPDRERRSSGWRRPQLRGTAGASSSLDADGRFRRPLSVVRRRDRRVADGDARRAEGDRISHHRSGEPAPRSGDHAPSDGGRAPPRCTIGHPARLDAAQEQTGARAA